MNVATRTDEAYGQGGSSWLMHLPTVSDCKHVFAAGHYNYFL